MYVAVTGGRGFIGSAVLRRCEELGHFAWAVDHADHGTDIMDQNLGDALDGADAVIHLAGLLGTAELFDRPEEAVMINVQGTVRVLKWCTKTDAAYVGITMPDSDWANVYQATKLCSMRLATAWHRNFGVSVSHVRAFNAYGPGQKHGPGHPQKIIPTFASYAWQGLPLPIWGDGLQTVDLIHVDDIARMLVDAVGFGDDETFDAGTGASFTVKQVARFVNRVCGQPENNLEFFPMRPGEEYQSNIQAKGEGWDRLGWQPEFSWDRLAETVQWYRA